MTKGGITIPTALESISAETDNAHFKAVLIEVLDSMKNGVPFSESVGKFPKVFNQLFCAMILAGETGGTLTETLSRLAQYYDNRDRLAKKIKSATTYPVFIFSFVMLAVIFLMTYIIPQFRDMFDNFGAELPTFTRVFMMCYDAVRFNAVYICIGLAILVTVCIWLNNKTQKGHYFFSRIAIGCPLFGKIFTQAFVALFCRTLGTLLSAGVSVLDAFDILAAMTKNDIIRNAVLRTKEYIVEGSSISLGLAASGFFPNMVITMVQSGEESGSLRDILERTAEHYERKVDATITTTMSLLEPIMIIFLGGIVLVVVLAMYLPIFTLSRVIK